MKHIKIIYALCAAIFVFGIIGSFIIFIKPGGQWVDILQDGNVIYHINLSKTKNSTINIEYSGGYNTVEIKDKSIRVITATCPDKTCVQMGSLDSGGLPIVCLPHKLVIKFSDADTDTDAAAW